VKLVIVVLVVCADPFKVIAVNVGSAGAAENDSDPPVTLNCVWSVAANALAGARPTVIATVAAAATARREIDIPWTFTSLLLDWCVGSHPGGHIWSSNRQVRDTLEGYPQTPP
jgi:hypothetical protein